MSTTNLELQTVPANAQQISVPVNDALGDIDATLAGLVTVEFTADANRTLVRDEYLANVLRFTDSPSTLTTGRDVVFPARFPLLLVINSTAQTLTLKKSGQTGITLASGATKFIAAGVTDVVEVGGGSITGGALTSALDEAKAADIASAATTDIGGAAGNFVHVTGTTTITALGSAQAGARRVVRFAGALTLTHNATSLILPTGSNITTAANDCAVFVSEGSGNWRCVAYQRASGAALAPFGSNTQSIGVACSDETTALTTGTAKATFRMPYAFTLTAVRASVNTAPTGAVLTVDINQNGSSILSTKLTIDAGEKTSTTAATAAVISDTTLDDDAEITIDIDTVGSTVAGAGLKVWLIGAPT